MSSTNFLQNTKTLSRLICLLCKLCRLGKPSLHAFQKNKRTLCETLIFQSSFHSSSSSLDVEQSPKEDISHLWKRQYALRTLKLPFFSSPQIHLPSWCTELRVILKIVASSKGLKREYFFLAFQLCVWVLISRSTIATYGSKLRVFMGDVAT